ncbi:hypothetical protein SCLCIDRAFT_1212763 [Scleroderma citrinum Foug A]|nr:hypothetical protein SCLCIDRAFT_1212763 [Scleroderma citrinum Foug A]
MTAKTVPARTFFDNMLELCCARVDAKSGGTLEDSHRHENIARMIRLKRSAGWKPSPLFPLFLSQGFHASEENGELHEV